MKIPNSKYHLITGDDHIHVEDMPSGNYKLYIDDKHDMFIFKSSNMKYYVPICTFRTFSYFVIDSINSNDSKRNYANVYVESSNGIIQSVAFDNSQKSKFSFDNVDYTYTVRDANKSVIKSVLEDKEIPECLILRLKYMIYVYGKNNLITLYEARIIQIAALLLKKVDIEDTQSIVSIQKFIYLNKSIPDIYKVPINVTVNMYLYAIKTLIALGTKKPDEVVYMDYSFPKTIHTYREDLDLKRPSINCLRYGNL